jgi:hypothetical protein
MSRAMMHHFMRLQRVLIKQSGAFFISNTTSWLLIPENNILEVASALLPEFLLAF